MTNGRLDKRIPKPLLDMLKERWRPSQGMWAIGMKYDKGWETRTSPAGYFLRPGGTDECGGILHKEALALNKCGFLEGRAVLLASKNQEVICVNEHAAHAIQDFCSEVYEAFDRLQARIDSLPVAAVEAE